MHTDPNEETRFGIATRGLVPSHHALEHPIGPKPLRQKLPHDEHSQYHIMEGLLILIDIATDHIDIVLAGDQRLQLKLLELAGLGVGQREYL